MSDFKVPEGATHFVDETDDFRAHFIQVDEAANVLAEFVPSVNYIGWDFDIEPYPMLADSIPVSAYKELTTLRQQNAEVRDKLTTITKQRDELLKCLETVNSHAVYRAGTFNNGETVAQYATRVLSTIKEQKDAE